jgi:hypothetical protein
MEKGVRVMKKGFVTCVGALVLALLMSHIAGFRELADVLNGAHPAAGAPIFWGLVYAKTHTAFFLIAPVLVLGAGVVSLLDLASAALGFRRLR